MEPSVTAWILERLRTRLALGRALVLDSVGVVGTTPQLLVFPFLAVSATLLFFPVFVVPGVLVGGWLPIVLACLGFAIFAKSVSTYCNAALVVGVTRRLNGQPLQVGTCFRNVNRQFGQLLVWSVASVLAAPLLVCFGIRGSTGRSGPPRLLYPWKVTLFFALPTILFEETRGRQILWRSLGRFENTREETLGAGIVTLFVTTLAACLCAAVATGLFVTVDPTIPVGQWAFVCGAVVLAGSVAVFLLHSINGIVRTALYLHDVESHRLPPFSTLGEESRRQNARVAGETGSGETGSEH